MLKTLGIPLLLFTALLAAACSSAAKATPTPTKAAAVAPKTATYTVQVDGRAPSFNAAFLAYFPKETAAHPGDTVQFKVIDTGEPHTVTLGTLVNDAVAAVEKAKPEEAANVPALAKVPFLIPPTGGDAFQVAAQPCFLEAGAPPAADACTKAQQAQSAFSGTQTYYNSGWLAENKPFVVKLADTVKPGTYALMCMLHREGMIGKLTVVASTATAPSPEDTAKKAAAELDTKVKGLQSAADAMTKLTADKAQAGNLAPTVLDGLVLTFGPKDVAIPVGGTVTWLVLGPHTVSFNAGQDAKTVRVDAPDGGVHLNPKALLPADSDGQPPAPAGAAPPPPPPGAPPIVINGGTWAGSGFHSSGIIVSFPPGPFWAYKMTFSKAGTYQFQCLIHDGMTGSVKVG